MALPSSGTITMEMIRNELKRTGTISLNDADVRKLAGKPSGAISMSDFWGKSAWTPVPINLSKTYISVGNSRQIEATVWIQPYMIDVLGYMNSQQSFFFDDDPEAPPLVESAGHYEFRFYDLSSGLNSSFSSSYTTTTSGMIEGRLYASNKGYYNCKFEIREKANINNKGIITIQLNLN